MTTKTDELKPCPFCGCANIHITPDEVGSGGQWVGPVHVVCGGDCVAGQSGDDRESAIAAWNRRAALQSQADPLLPKSPEWPKWYVVSKQGHATLYESESSARGSVRLRNDAFPESAPHAAMPLIPALPSQDREDAPCRD